MKEEALIMLHWNLWASDRSIPEYKVWKEEYINQNINKTVR